LESAQHRDTEGNIMSNIVGIVSFYPKKGVSVSDFLSAHEKYYKEFVSKQKGCISHRLLAEGDKWSDLVIWKTMEDTQSTFRATQEDASAIEIMSSIDQIGTDDDIPLFSVIKDHPGREKELMPGAVWLISYKLLKGASVPDFLLALEECHDKVLSKKKGFISWKVLGDGDTWADLVTWETMEDAVNAESNHGEVDPIAQRFYSFMNFNTIKMRAFSVKRNYK